MSDTADVHVYKAAEIDYIKITPEFVTLNLDDKQKYTALAYLDNGDTDDITRDTLFTPKTDADALIVKFGVTSQTSTLTAIGLGTATVVGRYLLADFEDEATVEVVE